MHLIATNACIVIRTLVKESSKEMIVHGSAHAAVGEAGLGLGGGGGAAEGHHDADSLGNWTFDHLAHCERIEIIGEAMEHASVYLYPFIIEYSIIGISVMYRWVYPIPISNTLWKIKINSTPLWKV